MAKWYESLVNTGMYAKGIAGRIVRKPVAISILMDTEDAQIEYDRLEHEVFVQEKARKVARALARERDLAYEKEAQD